MLKELPKKWVVESRGQKELNNYFNENSGRNCYDFKYGYYHSYNKSDQSIMIKGKLDASFHGSSIREGFTEISFEDFKRLVLQETPINNELEIEIW
jgi:hypothetical protein